MHLFYAILLYYIVTFYAYLSPFRYTYMSTLLYIFCCCLRNYCCDKSIYFAFSLLFRNLICAYKWQQYAVSVRIIFCRFDPYKINWSRITEFGIFLIFNLRFLLWGYSNAFFWCAIILMFMCQVVRQNKKKHVIFQWYSSLNPLSGTWRNTLKFTKILMKVESTP